MITLGLDTTTDRLSVAAGAPDGRRAQREATGARRHAALLVPLALEALGDLGAGLDQVGAVAMSDGPGSFTGLRVAAAWAKAFTHARGIPLLAASTLLVRAMNAAATGVVLGLGTALRGELYVGAYRFEPDGSIATVLRPNVLQPGAPLPGGIVPEVIVADVDATRLGAWPWAERATIVAGEDGFPRARCLIDLVDVRGGAVRIDDVAGWEPEYGRPAEAQARWERAHGRSLDDPARIA